MTNIITNRHGIGRRGLLKGGLLGGAMLALPSAAMAAFNTVEVQTPLGRLRGRQLGDVFEFRGIRYAEPQTAANRFRAPVPAQPWSGTREALENGLMAMQHPSRGGLWVLSFRDYGQKSEDCLTLNVYTPSIESSRKRAVMFWCHGGGFATGSGNVPVYDGHNLAEHGDVVVVTVNHRLNVFGYTGLHTLGGEEFADAGNAGMLDVVEALRWVRDNISEFGGDPDNVTIFGESGGGGKVSMLLGMPAAQGLFHKAIVQSGSGLRQQDPERSERGARALLDAFDLSPAEAGRLREIPAEQLLATAGPLLRQFAPAVDGNHLPRHSFDPDASPLAHDIPMIIGTNDTEATTFANDAMFNLTDEAMRNMLTGMMGPDMGPVIDDYAALYPDKSPSHLYFRIATDFMFRRSAIIQAERKVAQGGAPVFMYTLDYKSPVDGGRWLTPHAMDLPFMFRNHRIEQMVDCIGSGPDQDSVADAMSSAWIAFAKTGDPSSAAAGAWTPYDLDQRDTMVFDATSGMVSDPGSADRAIYMEGPAFSLMG